MNAEVLELACKVSHFKRRLVETLIKLWEVEKERDELKKELKLLKSTGERNELSSPN